MVEDQVQEVETVSDPVPEAPNMASRGAFIAHMKRHIGDPGARLDEVSDAWHDNAGLQRSYYNWDHTSEVAPDVSEFEAEYDRLAGLPPLAAPAEAAAQAEGDGAPEGDAETEDVTTNPAGHAPPQDPGDEQTDAAAPSEGAGGA